MIACTHNTPDMTAVSRCLLLPLILLVLTAETVLAQDYPAVTLEIKQGRMADVLKELEKQTNYRFYYDTTDLDTSMVDISARQLPFTKVLDQLFTEKDLSYTVDKNRYVYISRGEPIHTE